MKKIISIIILIMFYEAAIAQKADDLIGVWVTEDKDAWVEFFKKDNIYYGKTVWHDEKKHKGVQSDVMNPDINLKSRAIIGLVVIKNLMFKNNLWDDGECYDPEKGKYYNGYIKMIDKNSIKLRGYIGIPLFGRSEVWMRIK